LLNLWRRSAFTGGHDFSIGLLQALAIDEGVCRGLKENWRRFPVSGHTLRPLR
jgi:hypothetical protein